MARTIYRYRTSKPMDGHFSFQLPEGAQIMGYLEYWHTAKGWELVMDVLEDTRLPRERRHFFLCAGGDDLSFLGIYPEAYHIGTHYAGEKGYVSFVFDTSHLSEDQRLKGQAGWGKLNRPKPSPDELGRAQRTQGLSEKHRHERLRVVND